MADRMIEACRKAKVKLMYAEETLFYSEICSPKATSGQWRVGEPTLVKQSEKHDVPMRHIFGREPLRGGVTMDMGSRGLSSAGGCWVAADQSVYAQMERMFIK